MSLETREPRRGGLLKLGRMCVCVQPLPHITGSVEIHTVLRGEQARFLSVQQTSPASSSRRSVEDHTRRSHWQLISVVTWRISSTNR